MTTDELQRDHKLWGRRSTNWKLWAWLWKSCKYYWERKKISRQFPQQRWSLIYICLVSPHVMVCLTDIIHNPDFQGIPTKSHCRFPDQVEEPIAESELASKSATKLSSTRLAKTKEDREKVWPKSYALWSTTLLFAPSLIILVKGSEASSNTSSSKIWCEC